MQLSIIIPAYNEEELLEKSISQTQAAVWGAFGKAYEWELIVCDNASTDRTAEIAKSMKAHVISESVHRISRVRNRGASIAKGEFLLFIDADSFPEESLLEELKIQMKKTDFLGSGARINIQGGSLWGKLRMERLNPWMKLFKYTWGAFVCCRKDAFEGIAGFNEEMYALEEIDFVRRLKKYGRKKKLRFYMLDGYFISAGRKDEINIQSLFRLFVSNTAAVTYFLMHTLLPKSWRPKANAKLFGFWYKR